MTSRLLCISKKCYSFLCDIKKNLIYLWLILISTSSRHDMMPSSKRSWTKEGFREIMDWIDIKAHLSVNILNLSYIAFVKLLYLYYTK